MLAKLKNKIIEALTSVVASVLAQPRIQQMLDEIIGRHLNTRKDLESYFAESETKKQMWINANVRPRSADMHWAAIPNSIREWRMIEATREAGQFIQQNIPALEGHPSAYDTLGFCLDAVAVEGMYLEFGVFSGATINYIADKVATGKVHGFDSFEGLPESWGALAKGTFDTGGNLPEVRANVELHKGWFEDTIAPFLLKHRAPAAFIHVDADLYSSTNTILNGLVDRIVPGTIIVFDEYINYPYWKDNEYKSFMEFVDRNAIEFEYIAYTDRGYSVAVKIISISRSG